MKTNPAHTGDEEYCFFLAVIFPDSQLKIIDYNRLVKDLNGLTPEQLLAALEKSFAVEDKVRKSIIRPSCIISRCTLAGRWYSLTAKAGTYDDNDPIGVLDV